MTLAGRVFSNRYEIERELAQGGMAEVYLARDQLLNRPVALKALFPEYAREPSFVERFRREAQAAANLNHPNIVAIYDWGQESGTYFIVMEYVEGRSLRDLIRAEAPIDANTTAEIGAEIASALAFAHREGVVHRDVKPGNVLLTRSGNVKVTDFGIARAGTGDGLTQTGSVMGTATYFSPEQAQGQSVDGRSDVYSLGIVLYEMVTGVAPFTGDSPVAVAYKHVREDPVPPSQRNTELPPDLQQIILTALAKDPDARYQSADDMRADLLRFRRGRPLAAAPVTAMIAEVPTSATAAQAAGAYAAAATMASPQVDDRGRYAGTTTTYRRKRPNPWIVTLLVVLGLAGVIGLILWLSSTLGSSETQVTVPDVVGLKITDAHAALQSAHLQWIDNRVTDPAHAVDTVTAQDPGAAKKATQNSKVKLTVSNGAEQVMVPTDIVNKTEAAAKAELTALGFVPTSQPQADPNIPKGNVIDSIPKPGTQAGKGSSVVLLVSTGPQAVSVPDVRGLSQNAAGSLLTQQDFKTVLPASESSDAIPAGNATRTDPPAGANVSPDTPIKLFISTGPATAQVPSVIGQSQDAATTALQNAGFKVAVLKQVNPANAGNVVDQSPTAGGNAAKGSTVTITVAIAGGGATTTTT
jgi:serine/threonine-protein kinase